MLSLSDMQVSYLSYSRGMHSPKLTWQKAMWATSHETNGIQLAWMRSYTWLQHGTEALDPGPAFGSAGTLPAPFPGLA